MRRFTVAALLALALVMGLVGYAAGQVVPEPDGDDDRVSICVAGSPETGNPLTVAPAKRALYWLNEDLSGCQSGYTRVDWLNS